MTTSSAADWCRAILQEVSPSPLNNIPLPSQHVPPPPPPVYSGVIRKKTVAAPVAVAVAQPSTQYEAYYANFYSQQAAYAAPAVAAAATTSGYGGYQQQTAATTSYQQTQLPTAATTTYQQVPGQYSQSEAQRLLQQQQNALYYQQQPQQQPSYTAHTAQGAHTGTHTGQGAQGAQQSVWGQQTQPAAQGLRQTQIQQQAQRPQQAQQHTQGGATGFNQQQAANAQQYSQQHSQQHSQQQYAKSPYTQQQYPYSSSSDPTAVVGNINKTGEPKKTKSRFSAAPAVSAVPAMGSAMGSGVTGSDGSGAYGSTGSNINGNSNGSSNGAYGTNAYAGNANSSGNNGSNSNNSNGNVSNNSNGNNGNNGNVGKPSASSAESAKPANWPVSLKKFVDRSFALCKTDDDRKLVAQSLERLINRVAFDGRVSTHRWDLEDVSSIIFPPSRPEGERMKDVDRERDNERENEREKDRERDSQRERERERTKKEAQTASYRYNGVPAEEYKGGTYGINSRNVSTDFGHKVPGSYNVSSPANSRYGPGSGFDSGFGSSSQPAMSPSHSDNGGGGGNVGKRDVTKKRKNRWDLEGDNDGNNGSKGNNGNSNVSESYYSVYKETSQQSVNGKYKSKSPPTDKYDGDVKVNLNKKAKTNEVVGINRALTKLEQATRDKRADRFKDIEEKEPEKYVRYTLESQSQIQFGKKNKMKKRGGDSVYYGQADSTYSTSSFTSEFDFESLIVIGTSQKIEKEYFRLTSAPLPNTVRPENILRQTLVLLKDKWDKNVAEYVYMCSQFKSMRQDLTVQHIQNDLTVEVYECHARVALESRDLNEYNQCQTQLKQLYSTMKIKKVKCIYEMEFTAYRILYYVYLQGNKKYQNGSSDLADIMQSLSEDAFKDPAVSHALLLRKSIQSDNYHKFFQLYRLTPNLGNCILDLMIDNKRLLSLQKIVRSYKPHVPVSFVSSILNFDNDDDGKEFILKAGCIMEEINETNGLGISMTQLNINTKDSVVDTSAILTQEKLLL